LTTSFESPFSNSDLRDKYLAGGPGTYKGVFSFYDNFTTWTKQ
jgi:hypothetical protein